ncbi:hypothetical protein EVAR_16430_1 [Eumeta japonica]|uniref:Uncharacterized protein n=1 Tax=Eumeta variegata TaxID=151549 RepID=A0A4C1UL14_EUMVA|nr:hypothetical protein EVAR_16430_1 [Eumeta japonica]
MRDRMGTSYHVVRGGQRRMCCIFLIDPRVGGGLRAAYHRAPWAGVAQLDAPRATTVWDVRIFYGCFSYD